MIHRPARGTSRALAAGALEPIAPSDEQAEVVRKHRSDRDRGDGDVAFGGEG